MSKKSNPDKGLRTVNIDFAGKNRQLKFSHTAIGNFEADCAIALRGIVAQGTMIFADSLMGPWIENSKVLALALWHGLRGEDDSLTRESISSSIDDYIEAGGKKIDLIRSAIRAYKLATDPSIVASLERNWRVSDERQAMFTAAENQQIEAVEKALLDAKARLTPGSTTSDLPD